jgi:polynucleotide 5'-hydroxyl-kinase GRC3/NOL9
MLPTLVGAKRLQRRAVELGAAVILVDTTGLIARSQGGGALKQWKIELLAPTAVVALQRSQEMEHILWPLRRDGRIRCVELPVSPRAVVRSREVRIARRRARLADYFAGADERRVTVQRMVVYGLECMVRGALIAFQDEEGYCLGLGVVEEVRNQRRSCTVRTPIESLDGVSSVRFGSARWDVRAQREF